MRGRIGDGLNGREKRSAKRSEDPWWLNEALYAQKIEPILASDWKGRSFRISLPIRRKACLQSASCALEKNLMFYSLDTYQRWSQIDFSFVAWQKRCQIYAVWEPWLRSLRMSFKGQIQCKKKELLPYKKDFLNRSVGRERWRNIIVQRSTGADPDRFPPFYGKPSIFPINRYFYNKWKFPGLSMENASQIQEIALFRD